MIKARRMYCGLEMHEPVAPTIKTLVRDNEPGKTVTAHFEPGTENAEWRDEPRAGFLYSAVDAEEGLVLFPEYAEGASIMEPTDAEMPCRLGEWTRVTPEQTTLSENRTKTEARPDARAPGSALSMPSHSGEMLTRF
ncbi:hypothetical protein AC578_9669 [Pseudocercospora eumusae]|uniref:Uncharacterized protein n=1 Tax=Pseudocercospora eumusae TaxID=321146 RepID=A0A139HR13_9PEZI|nr:hypothetical protein AC578_9669 [Pseudocercospora eumusae]